MTPIEQGGLFVLAGLLGLLLSSRARSGRYSSAVGLLNIWLALPGIFFVVYVTRGFVSADVGIVLFSSAFTAIMLGLLVAATRGMQGAARGAVVVNGTFVNSVNLPFPILQVAMGTYSYAATFAATTNAIQILAARVLQQRFGTGSGGGGRSSVARTAPLISLGLGVLVHYIAWPASPSGDLVDTADLLENVFIAIIFVQFGMALGNSLRSGRGFGIGSRSFRITALFRLLVGPLLALILAVPFGEGSAVYLQMVFEASMPPAVINTVIARVYGFDVDSTARATTVLTPVNTAEAVVLLELLRGV